MTKSKKFLFMVMLGCKPLGRLTEQHDVFFGVARDIEELVPNIKTFWPDGGDTLHIDAWRKVSVVGEYLIDVVERDDGIHNSVEPNSLFFINLGGYKLGEFDEFHKKILVISKDKSSAIKNAKNSFFYKEMGFNGAASHVDEKYGLDVDDIIGVDDLLPLDILAKYKLMFSKKLIAEEDMVLQGYMQLHRIHLPS